MSIDWQIKTQLNVTFKLSTCQVKVMFDKTTEIDEDLMPPEAREIF